MGAKVSSGLYVQSAPGLRRRDQAVRRLTRKMRLAMPWLQDCDVPTCRAWAEIELLASRAYMILASVGISNGQGEPLRLLGDFRLLRQTQLSYARELRMTPAARSSLKASSRDLFDLPAAMARGDVEDVPDGSDENDAGNAPG